MPLIFSLFSTAQCTISSVSYFLYKATISYWGIVGETGSSGALLEGFAWEHFSLTSPQCQWTHFHGRRVWITVNSAVILSQSNSQKNRIKSNHNFQWNLVFCNMTGCPPKSWWLMIPAERISVAKLAQTVLSSRRQQTWWLTTQYFHSCIRTFDILQWLFTSLPYERRSKALKYFREKTFSTFFCILHIYDRIKYGWDLG